LYNTGEHEGILLTQASLGVHVGSWAPYFLAISIFFFAFSSVIGCYYYGETNIEFIKASNTWLTIYRFAALGMVMFGSVAQVALIWNMADLFMGLVSFLNLIVILVLGRVAFQVLDDYVAQRRAGKDPQFYAKNIPGLKNVPTWGNER
jgi:AGCS family alanine or glycine:cation symporter